MTQINFYQVKDGVPAAVDAAVPRLLEKVVERGHKVLIKCNSSERVQRLSETLWGYEPTSFLTHGTPTDGYADKQTIFITHQNENPAGADVLLLISNAQFDGLEKFDRVLNMFDASEQQTKLARERWKEYSSQSYELSYYANENGAWVKKA